MRFMFPAFFHTFKKWRTNWFITNWMPQFKFSSVLMAIKTISTKTLMLVETYSHWMNRPCKFPTQQSCSDNLNFGSVWGLYSSEALALWHFAIKKTNLCLYNVTRFEFICHNTHYCFPHLPLCHPPSSSFDKRLLINRTLPRRANYGCHSLSSGTSVSVALIKKSPFKIWNNRNLYCLW